MTEPVRYEDEDAYIAILIDAKYWGSEDEERFTHTDPEDAIEGLLDSRHPHPITEERLTIVGVSPRSVAGQADQRWILEEVLERLDEDFGDWEGESTEPTDEMKAAAKVFAEAIEKAYTPFQCDETARFTFNPLEWAREHRPDWLETPASVETS
jgi:hypothetical protein